MEKNVKRQFSESTDKTVLTVDTVVKSTDCGTKVTPMLNYDSRGWYNDETAFLRSLSSLELTTSELVFRS